LSPLPQAIAGLPQAIAYGRTKKSSTSQTHDQNHNWQLNDMS